MDGDALLLMQEARQKWTRTCDMHVHSHLAHALNIRACHAAVQHIPEDGDLQPSEFPLVLLNGIEVEKPLRRMCMRTISRIDDDR